MKKVQLPERSQTFQLDTDKYTKLYIVLVATAGNTQLLQTACSSINEESEFDSTKDAGIDPRDLDQLEKEGLLTRICIGDTNTSLIIALSSKEAAL